MMSTQHEPESKDACQIIHLAGGKNGKGDVNPKAVEPAKLALAVLLKLKRHSNRA